MFVLHNAHLYLYYAKPMEEWTAIQANTPPCRECGVVSEILLYIWACDEMAAMLHSKRRFLRVRVSPCPPKSRGNTPNQAREHLRSARFFLYNTKMRKANTITSKEILEYAKANGFKNLADWVRKDSEGQHKVYKIVPVDDETSEEKFNRVHEVYDW